MKLRIKQYWLVLVMACSAFGALMWLEQRKASNTAQQLRDACAQVQQVTLEKEVRFIRVIQQIMSDSSNYQRNWGKLNSIGQSENISIHIFRNDTLQVWSSNDVNGELLLRATQSGSGFLHAANGYFLTYRYRKGSFTYLLLYGIKSDFAFRNQYIENRFSRELSFIREGFILPRPAEGFTDIHNLAGDYLFSVQVFTADRATGKWTVVAMLLCIVAGLMMVHGLTRHYILRYPWLTTIVFFAVFGLLRSINIYYHVPAFLYELRLFDSSVYASSAWLPSLGDLLLDSMIVMWFLVLLENRNRLRLRTEKRQGGFLFGLAWRTLVLFISALVACEAIRSITIDSQISFDINNFSSINLFTYMGIMATILQSLAVYFICRKALRYFDSGKVIPMQLRLLVTVGAAVSAIAAGWFLFHLDLFRLAAAVIYLAALIGFKRSLSHINRFQQYFVVVFIISLFLSVSINHWMDYKERENRKLFAGKLISQNDITTDYFLRNIEKKLLNDDYIEDYFQNPIIIKSQFEKRIRQLYFTGYLSKFEVSMFDFDTMGYAFKQRNAYSFAQLNKTYQKQSLETINQYFRFVKSGALVKGYLARFTIQREDAKLGYLFILLRPKLIQDENRFDELLIEGFRQNRKNLADYSYALYKDKNLIYQIGNYPFRITNTWGETDNQFRFFSENNYDHMLYTDRQPLTIAVSKPADTLLKGIGLFSFIFTICTVALVMILFVYIGLNAQLFRKYRVFNNRVVGRIRNVFNRFMLIDNPDILYIRTRIQTSIIFIVFITLMCTSYFTITFITQKYNNRQTERLMKKLRNVVITVENEKVRELNYGTAGELEGFINQIADFYDTDITLFNPEGRVMTSSISRIYDDSIISNVMQPDAYFHLNQLKESQYTQHERISALGFQAAYAPVFRNKGEVLGYLQLPYFSQQADLLTEISSVIVGFINLYVLLFIIIGIIAYLVSRNISAPLSLIQQKLGRTVLGSKNEPISWQRDDEIGELVKQYNYMILQLDESARKLAETEREGAWREIARQIAHEIKNPLTPMKLSIQHLQRAYANNDPNIGERVNRTAQLLINQIDTLSDLAGEFSSFAKMPAPVYEQIEVCEELRHLVDLYSANTEVDIRMECPPHTTIRFDRSYFSRSLGNIIKNAIQAIPEDQKGEVSIAVHEDNESVRIDVRDNGSGMTAEQAGRIFMPYFSTKVSGMGLGLPIVKNMIESGNGKISFVTHPGLGTTFTVTLPKTSP